jgi:hypothetical protein
MTITSKTLNKILRENAYEDDEIQTGGRLNYLAKRLIDKGAMKLVSSNRTTDDIKGVEVKINTIVLGTVSNDNTVGTLLALSKPLQFQKKNEYQYKNYVVYKYVSESQHDENPAVSFKTVYTFFVEAELYDSYPENKNVRKLIMEEYTYYDQDKVVYSAELS